MRDCKNCFFKKDCDYEQPYMDILCHYLPCTTFTLFEYTLVQDKETNQIKVYANDNLICAIPNKPRLLGQNEAYQIIDLAERMDLIANDD